jgi:hypothetical protein
VEAAQAARLEAERLANETAKAERAANATTTPPPGPSCEGGLYTLEGCCCRVPFEYGGEMYYNCTEKDHTGPWCDAASRGRAQAARSAAVVPTERPHSGE